MNSNPEPDLDHQLLADDPTTPGWQTRAVRQPIGQALKQLPTVGRFETQIPIVPFRALQQHIKAQGDNQARWVRNACIAQYLRQGGDPTTATQAADMQRVETYRDVPRDQQGQHRRRVGRGGYQRL